MKHTLISLCFLLLLASCGIEKRHYRPGFYVPPISSVPKKLTVSTGEVSCSDTVVGIQAGTEIAKAEPERSEEKTVVRKKSGSAALAMSSIRAKESYQQKFVQEIIPEVREVRIELKHTRRGNKWKPEDMVAVIGGVTCLSGIGFAALGSTVFKAEPGLSEALIIAGVVLILIGYILLCIAYPEFFLELLLDFILSVLGA